MAAVTTETDRRTADKSRLFSNARLWMGVAAVLLLASLVSLPFAVKYLRQAPPAEPFAVRFTIAAPEKATVLRASALSPDGRNLASIAPVDGVTRLWLRPLNSLANQQLPVSDVSSGTIAWSPDSRSICFNTQGTLKRVEIAGGAPQTLCSLPRGWSAGDGATAWNREGVQSFPASGGEWQISTNGGSLSNWRGDGKELYYISGRKMMAVDIKPGTAIEVGVPKVLFDLSPLTYAVNTDYAVTADGQRFLIVTQGQEVANLQFTVVVNWAAEAKK